MKDPKKEIESLQENSKGINHKIEEQEKEDISLDESKLNTLDIASLKKKADEYDFLWDKYLRVCAEFDNTRKRWEKEKKDIVKFANYSLIKELLTIIDESEHALKSIRESSPNNDIGRGVEMVYNNLLAILNKQGLKVMNCVGNRFDPHCHEIVGYKEINNDEEYVILEEVQKGYFLEDKVLRTAKVIVGVKPKGKLANDENKLANDENKENHTKNLE
ncbi:MAG: nucleotide exchange factor GrpE [Candidatus Omnitrophica bacterium]|nr:nucleotide exchange factor GrpE [Candidatus Omnitrophota bacterium]MCM8827506.1 nucleotide exchange factor GrpE [Candidatus Omnitrophota bacterium]